MAGIALCNGSGCTAVERKGGSHGAAQPYEARQTEELVHKLNTGAESALGCIFFCFGFRVVLASTR